MRTGEKQYWRVLNASAITYVDLRLTFDNIPQRVELVAIDGIPLNYEHPEESTSVVKDHILLPPGARAEFVVTAPRVGVKALLVTRSVDTGRVGDNAPLRTIAPFRASESTAQPRMLLDVAPSKRSVSGHVPLARVKPVRQRLLYFSERPANPKDPSSPTMFFVTVDGQPRAVRSHFGFAQYYCSCWRRRGLDHRKPITGIARFPYPSNALPVIRMEWDSGIRTVPIRH